MKPPLRIILFLVTMVFASSLRADIVHRWTFNNPNGSADGATILDTIQGAVATVVGTGATFSGSALTLPGGTNGNQAPAAIAAYVDLPNRLISSKANLSVEIWATPLSYQQFSRLLDFGRVVQAGNGAPGEITGLGNSAPGTTQASDALTLTLSRNGGNLNQQRLEGKLDGTTNTADAAGLFRQVDTSLTTTAGTAYQFVLTFEDGVGTFGAAGGRLSWYRNGALAATTDVGFHLSSIEDVNDWLGRSLWTGDMQANVSYDDVRIYNHALSAAEISASFAAGANPSYAAPIANADAATVHPGQKVRVAVLANDTGVVSGPTVTVVQAPAFGTAVPDGTGKILYTHTTGAPARDSFTYRVKGPGGTSAPALVTITFSNSLRIANPTLNVPSSPPPLAIQLATAFTGLAQPVGMATPPGETRRLFVCQKGGLLRVIQDVTASAPVITTFLDLPTLFTDRNLGETLSTNSEQGLLSAAFHPDYASNGYFYVFYSVNLGGSTYERVSRFTAQAANANAADATTELVLLQQLDEQGNHNGGDMHFGPDGYLYISLGDEGNQYDRQNNSQTITKDFFSAFVRIDVDKKPGNLEPNAHPNPAQSAPVVNAVPRYETAPGSGVFKAAYSIPLDNPFVATAQGGSWAGSFNGTPIAVADLPYVRSEFWAVGFRNPWRFSFDAPTGELWEGEVGQDTYEEINVVTKGKNYGWAFREAAHNGPKSGSAPANFDALYHTPPIYEYVHASVAGDSNFKGNSCSGGIVYRGTRISSLTGAYIFADYVSGNIWSLVRNGSAAPTVTRIAGEVGIVAFAADPSNGDVLLADFDGNRILRLTSSTPSNSYPQTLSATNLFADLTDLSPSPSVLPYAVNLPFWSDYAVKRRWFTIPDGTSTMTWARDGLWTFPSGTIWVKHFDLEMTRGNPATKKRIETRLIVKNATGAYGVSYRWNDAGTDASLVPDSGVDFDLAISANGAPATQRWHIPSRAECLACHTPQAGYALSFTTRQLNLASINGNFAGNQLDVMRLGGCFGNAPASPNVLPRHLRPDETSFPVEARTRSYFAVNCAYCHKAGGTAAPAAWDGRPELTLAQTGLINGAASNNGGSPLNKLIVPGDTTHSIVLNRLALTNGFTRMPPIGSNELDQTNIALVSDWIANALPNRQTYGDWRLAQFGSGTSADGDPAFDADSDGSTNYAEFLGGTQPLSGASALHPQPGTLGSNATLTFTLPANRSAQIETSTDLTSWSLWDAPGNAGLPLSGGPVTITGPQLGPKQFFRLNLREN